LIAEASREGGFKLKVIRFMRMAFFYLSDVHTHPHPHTHSELGSWVRIPYPPPLIAEASHEGDFKLKVIRFMRMTFFILSNTPNFI
jgi:hypothetical protein